MDNKFVTGKGITVTTNFDISTALPIDSRTVVYTVDDLKEMSPDIVYEGLLVFVKDGENGNKLYQWKKNLDENGVLSEDYGWGPIEAEISARDIIEVKEQIDFENMKTLMMQRNKKDFFPMSHENFIFVDKGDETLSDKYQTREDNTLKTTNKNIPEAINEINDFLDEQIKDFNERVDQVLEELDDKVAAAEGKIDAAEEVISERLDSVEKDINNRVDQMLKDTDNTVLSDIEVNDLWIQIESNLAALDGIENPSDLVVMSSFNSYNGYAIVDTAVTEVSLEPLKVTVTNKDKLFVHKNSVYLTENVDYYIDYSGQKIVNMTSTPWNNYNIAGCEFTFDLIKKA